ncbi:MAG: helix-turn-helix transcriptional regulator [Hyphomicrobiales bacterium]|nr:helix-turn-helix transcriptional regulator [Hyphomicrobiales bacterium]
MRWNELDQEPCSIARTLSVIGDRWTMLILREIFFRHRRFEEMQGALNITRPVLAQRLRKLVSDGVLRKVAYQSQPARYEYRLTDKGAALSPVMMALMHWGDTQMLPPGTERAVKLRHCSCNTQFDPVMTCSACHEPLAPRAVRMERRATAQPGLTQP